MLVIKVTHSAQSFDFGLAVTIQPYLFPSQTCAQDAFGGISYAFHQIWQNQSLFTFLSHEPDPSSNLCRS